MKAAIAWVLVTAVLLITGYEVAMDYMYDTTSAVTLAAVLGAGPLAMACVVWGDAQDEPEPVETDLVVTFIGSDMDTRKLRISATRSEMENNWDYYHWLVRTALTQDGRVDDMDVWEAHYTDGEWFTGSEV